MSKRLNLVTINEIGLSPKGTLNDFHKRLKAKGIDGFITWDYESVNLHIVMNDGFGVFCVYPYINGKHIATLVSDNFINLLKRTYSEYNIENKNYHFVGITEEMIFENCVRVDTSPFKLKYDLKRIFYDGTAVKDKLDAKDLIDYCNLCIDLSTYYRRVRYNFVPKKDGN